MLAPGSTVDKFEILGEMGQGGMARVFKVRHTLLGSLHALKVLDAKLVEDAELRQRFLAEGQIQARLRHPHIVAITDVVIQPGIAGLVAEFVEGKTLDEHIASLAAPPSVDEVKAIFRPLLSALGFAHAHGVVHRDIKPHNVILGKNPDGSWCPKILDFGIAKVTDDLLGIQGSKGRTRTGQRMGTVHYMSPEQIKGVDDLDHRTDIFSMAVTLYEVITRRVPFEAGSDFDTWRQIVDGAPVPIRTLEPGVDPVLEQVVNRGLHPDRAQRFQSCEEFAALLERAGQPVAAPRPPGRTQPAVPPSPPSPSSSPPAGAPVVPALAPRAPPGMAVPAPTPRVVSPPPPSRPAAPMAVRPREREAALAPGSRLCVECGSMVPGGARFCTGCGAGMPGEPMTPPPSTTPTRAGGRGLIHPGNYPTSPVLVVLLSLGVPGLGHLLINQVGKGLFVCLLSIAGATLVDPATLLLAMPLWAIDAGILAGKLAKRRSIGKWEWF